MNVTMNIISIVISVIAFLMSAATFWLTRIKRGIIKMTRPTIIFFGPDGMGDAQKKIFIRTLLYSTSERGRYIQNMFIRLQYGESIKNFNFWAYGETEFVRGSGLFINREGVSYNHHFLMPKDENIYNFSAGKYLLEVFIEPVDKKPQKIFGESFIITAVQEQEMISKGGGLYFNWEPDSQTYSSHVDIGKRKQNELV